MESHLHMYVITLQYDFLWQAELGSPKDVHVWVLRSGEFVTLDNQRNSAGVVWVRILKWEIILACLGGSSVITEVL